MKIEIVRIVLSLIGILGIGFGSVIVLTYINKNKLLNLPYQILILIISVIAILLILRGAVI